MIHMADFARPFGAKDKQKRKERNRTLKYGGLGALGYGGLNAYSWNQLTKPDSNLARKYPELADKIREAGISPRKMTLVAGIYGGALGAGAGLAGLAIKRRLEKRKQK